MSRLASGLAAVLLLIASSTGAITVSGTIGSSTWLAEQSPVMVTDDLILDAGAVLSIHPGVEVFADSGVVLHILGSLQAAGTESDSIRFLPSGEEPWGGLRFGAGDTSTLSYVRVSGSRSELGMGGGIWLNNARLGLYHSVISDNYAEGNGGGLVAMGEPSLTISHCAFARNATTYEFPAGQIGGRGGGAYIEDPSYALVEESAFTGNSNLIGGGLALEIPFWQPLRTGIATIRNCTFTGNTARDGAGLYVYAYNLEEESNQSLELPRIDVVGGYFDGNEAALRGGGIRMVYNCTLSDAVLMDNLAPSGGGASVDGTVDITGTLFAGNRAEGGPGLGGGLAITSDETVSDVSVANCTFTGNAADGVGPILGGGIGVRRITEQDLTIHVLNSIVWGNLSEDIDIEEGATAEITYSDIGGGYAGTGNIDADPLFVDSPNGDFRLQTGSPALDTGDPASPLDVDGSRADMGVRYAVPDPTGIATGVPTAFSLRQNMPNPFNPSTTIRFSLPEAGSVTLAVYDPAGRLVRTLVAGQLHGGEHSLVWDGRDGAGRAVGSGVYFYRLEAGSYRAARKMTFVR